MILRFVNRVDGRCINIDTAREEQSENHESNKKYVKVSDADFCHIAIELDFAGFQNKKILSVDSKHRRRPDPLPFN